MVKVTLKWKKETYKDVEFNENDTVETFRAQVFSLTGVPPERQKIMGVKGGMLKDDADPKALGLRDGLVLMLIGTADEVREPEKKTQFIEDLGHESTAVALLPPGLENLGNTCYLNATLQCLRNVPELRAELNEFAGSSADQNAAMLLALREVFNSLGQPMTKVSPYMFLSLFRQVFPQFAEQQRGQFMQQDAEEAWTQLMSALRGKLVRQASGDAAAENSVDRLFGVELTSTIKPAEPIDEPPTTAVERTPKLRCNISADISFMMQGIRAALTEQIEKNSEVAGRQVLYNKESLISSLPPYVTVQFMRFAWRQDTQKKAKVLRPVTFPQKADFFDLCTDALKDRLRVHRNEATEAAERALRNRHKSAEEMAVDDAPRVTGPCGCYELCAVLTHQGRYADSGHYIAWVKQDTGAWLKFDDDKVSEVKEEAIAELAGGGDWHAAYMVLYRERNAKGEFVTQV